MIVRVPGFAPTRSRMVIFNGVINVVAVARTLTTSMYEQAVEALKALDDALTEAGSDKHHLLTVTVFISDMQLKSDLNRAWDEWASRSAPPLRACMGAELEPGYMVEILATAVTPSTTTSGSTS